MRLVNCSILVGTQLTYGAQRKAETGDYQALPNQPKGSGHKITDWEKFREFAGIDGDKTQVQMAQLWDGEISDTQARHATLTHNIKGIKENRLDSKKKLMATGNEIKINDRTS